MRNNIVGLIQAIALAMFVLSIIGLAVLKMVGIVQCIELVFGSVLVYGFSFVVEAACKYLNKCEYEEYSANLKKAEE